MLFLHKELNQAFAAMECFFSFFEEIISLADVISCIQPDLYFIFA
jgi:hypothetical protein